MGLVVSTIYSPNKSLENIWKRKFLVRLLPENLKRSEVEAPRVERAELGTVVGGPDPPHGARSRTHDQHRANDQALHSTGAGAA